MSEPQGSEGTTQRLPVIEKDTVVPNAQGPTVAPAVHLSGNASVAGPFCVLVYDVGNLTEPITYTVNVLHS